MPRMSPIDQADGVQHFAEMYVSGASRQQIADFFNIHKDSVKRWLKRPDVQAAITEMNRQRVNRMVRKIDAAIEQRLEDTTKIDTDTLLKIRKELVPQKVEVGKAGEFGERAEFEAWAALDAGEEVPELEEGEDYEEVDEIDG